MKFANLPLSRTCSTRLAAACALVMVGLAGCAGPSASVEGRAPGLEPGTKIEVGKVVTPPRESSEVDVAALMRKSLDRALAEEGLAWSGDHGDKRVRLDLEVLDYDPGNAFKRWLLPGFGSTVLQVSGRLTDVRTGSSVGNFHHKLRVAFGGAYTIGAWRTIFDNVSTDVARSLANRTFNDGFVVGLDAWSSREIEIPIARSPQIFTIAEVRDLRPDKTRIGERFAAFGVSMGNVYLFGNVESVLLDTISDELRGAGHTVQNSGPGRSLSLDILSFWAETKTTPLYWDIVADIRIRVRVERTAGTAGLAEREFSCEASERTYVWPSEELFSEALDDCLKELMAAFRSDRIWNGAS